MTDARSTVCAVLAAPLLALSGCGDGGGELAFWDEEVRSLSSWSEVSPSLPRTDGPVEDAEPQDVQADVGGRRYHCTTTPASLTATPNEFVAIDPDQSVVWLGNLIQGASHYRVGALDELSIRERAPLRISIDLLRGDNARVVENPSLTTVQSAIGDLVEQAVAAGHEAASSASYEWTEASSSREAMLRLGFSGEYLGGSAAASLESETAVNERSYFAYFIQRAFTVSMELPSTPHDLLSTEFTPARLDVLREAGAIGPDNPPLFVSSVTFGRILIYRMTSSDEAERVAAAISASYSGTFDASGYAEAEIRETLSNARIQISTFGGDQSDLDRLIRTGRLQEYFAGDTALTSMEPISFELRTLADRRIASITRTTEYDVRECNNVTEPIGARLAVSLDHIDIPFDCDPGPAQGDMYGQLRLVGRGEPIRAWSRARSAPIDVQSGNRLTLNRRVEIDRYNGESVRIIGELRDVDGGLAGADETVGRWNFAIAARGSARARASGNCRSGNDRQPVLHYTVTRLRDIYPSD